MTFLPGAAIIVLPSRTGNIYRGEAQRTAFAIPINDRASKTALLRSATQFVHTCASVGEFARVMIESENSRKEGNALRSQILFSSPENKICGK